MKTKSIYLLFIALAACGERPFQEVISHYSRHAGDSLKLRAARFLIENMPYHGGVTAFLADSLGERVDTVAPWEFKTDTLYKKWLDSTGYHLYHGERVADVQAVTPAFLIENIELAFDAWQKPWARHLTFEEFREYILPYRCGYEMLSGWRRYFHDYYLPILEDSVKEQESTLEVARYLVSLLQKRVTYSPAFGKITERQVPPRELEKIRFAECRAIAHYGTLAMRAVGLPVSMITIHWRFGNYAHSTNLLYARDSIYRFAIHDEFQRVKLPKDSMASYRAWRYTFAPDPEIVRMLARKEEIPGELAYPVWKEDITSLLCTTRPVSLAVPEGWEDSRHLYLCRFRDWQWYPIRQGKVAGGKVTFEDATIRQLYRLGRYRAGVTETRGDVFTLKGDGSVERVVPSAEKGNVRVVYNCKPSEREPRKVFTTHVWTAGHAWEALTGEGVLWGLNEKSGEYKVFTPRDEGVFTPVFHMVEYKGIPVNTFFYDDIRQRPMGLTSKRDSIEYDFMVY
jgi:hypothetical protein